MNVTETEIFRAEGLPLLQNRLYETEELARCCPVGDVRLKKDPVTSIIQNGAFEAHRVVYDREYNNEQAASPAFRAHLDYIADLIRTNFDEASVIEVGCGKGVFIDYLRRRKFEVTGLDPAYEGEDPAIQKCLFKAGLGLQASGIVLRHVLEHIENPVSFLGLISEANRGLGKIYIEVPCFDWICENRAWFDIFYEHVNYFRVCDFERMFGKIHHIERTFGGQYLSIIASLDSLTESFESNSTAERFPNLETDIERVSREIQEWKNISSRKIAVWGAGSKGVVFSIHMKRLNVAVDYVVDINPEKVGKFLPCSGIEVISPQQFVSVASPGTRVLVMNPNYLNEIVALAGESYEYSCV